MKEQSGRGRTLQDIADGDRKHDGNMMNRPMDLAGGVITAGVNNEI
jgi:hypothetical protein